MKDQNHLAQIYARTEQAKRTCLWPGCECNAINSHLLQKRGLLSQIAKNGQLYRLHKNPFTMVMRFEKIGINDALAFKGFCNVHDTKIFQSIENGKLDFASYKSKLLLNYRAIQHNIRKTEVNIDFAAKAKTFAISKGIPTTVIRAAAELESQKRVLKNYLAHENVLFSALDKEDELFHFTVIKAPKLDVATSAVHQFETMSETLLRVQLGFDPFRATPIYIHILPFNEHTQIIISCRHDALAKASNLIIDATANPIKFVSDTLIKRIETWVCSPDLYFKSLKHQTQKIIKESEKYPHHADADEYISLNIFKEWI